MFKTKFFSLILLLLFIVQIVALVSLQTNLATITTNNHANDKSSSTRASPGLSANLANNSLLATQPDQNKNTTQQVLTTASTSTSSSINNNPQSTWRVDYAYDPIAPAFDYIPAWQYGGCIASPSTCTTSFRYYSFSTLTSADNNYAQYQLFISQSDSVSHSATIDNYWYFNTKNLAGTIYLTRAYYGAISGATVTNSKFYTTTASTNSLFATLGTSASSNTLSNPYTYSYNGMIITAGFIESNFASAATSGSSGINIQMDAFYYQPTTQTTYPLMSSSYQGNGKFIDSVTGHPSASGSVTIYNSTNTVFSSASNAYSSMSVVNNSVVLTGLPSNVDTTVYFTKDQSQEVYSISENTTLQPSLIMSNKIQKNGQGAQLIGDYFQGVLGTSMNFDDGTTQGWAGYNGGTVSVVSNQLECSVTAGNEGCGYGTTDSNPTYLDRNVYNVISFDIIGSISSSMTVTMDKRIQTGTIYGLFQYSFTVTTSQQHFSLPLSSFTDSGTYTTDLIHYNQIFFQSSQTSGYFQIDNIQLYHNDSQTTENSITFGKNQGNLLGNYFIEYNFYSITASQVTTDYFNGVKWISENWNVYTNTWNSLLFYVSSSNYDANGNIFDIISYGQIYFVYINLYSFNYTYSNNKISGNSLISGKAQFITDAGLLDASFINISLSIYNSTYSKINSYYILTQLQGFFEFSFPELNNETYNIVVKKSISPILTSSYSDSFEYSSLTSLNTAGWWDGGIGIGSGGTGTTTVSTTHVRTGTYAVQPSNDFFYTKLSAIASSFTITAWLYASTTGSFGLYALGQNHGSSVGYNYVQINYADAGAGSCNFGLIYNGVVSGFGSSYTTGVFTGSWINVTATGSLNPLTGVMTIKGYINGVLGCQGTESSLIYGYAGVGNADGAKNGWWDDFSSSYTLTDWFIPVTPINIVSQSEISYSVTENTVAYVMSQDNKTGNLFAKVWMDNVYQGVYQSNQVIYKSSTIGSHIFSYKFIASDNYVIGGTSFVNSTYTIVNSDLETLIFRDQQNHYIDPDTFNVYYNSQRIVGGSFYVSDTSQTFNLTITDQWNYSVYQELTSAWARIKDIQITLYNAKVQNYQPDPVWVNIQRGSGATYSQWVFSGEVISYWLLPASNYHIYYNFANVYSNYTTITNTTVTDYTFTLSSDIAFRITGTTLSDIFSNVNAVINKVDTVSLTLNVTQATVNETATTMNIIYNVQNGNFSLISNNLTLMNSHLDGNFTFITNTLNMLNTALNGNISLVTSNLNLLNATLNGNITFNTNLLNIINSALLSNFSVTTQTLSLLNSTLTGNITFNSNLLNILNSALKGNISLTLQTLSILNSTLQGNLTLQTQFLDVMNSTFLGNLTLQSQYLNVMNSTLGGNITLIADFLQIMDSSLGGNFSTIIANTLQTLSSVASVNSTLLQSLAFQIQVNQFYLSDSYVNLYVTSTQNFNYLAYENDTFVGSGSGLRAGTFINYARNTGIGVFLNVGIKFYNGSNSVWYNTSYNNAAMQALLVAIGAPILANDLLQLSVSSNYADATYYINDSLVPGLQVNWEKQGVFAWDVNASMYGVHSINVTARIDLNGDGLYTATGEVYSQIITWNYFEQDLIIQNIQFTSDFDKQLTLNFQSNYFGKNRTYFRVKTYNQTVWSSWFSEDLTNGSYSFSTANLAQNVKYVFQVQIQANITKSSIITQMLNYTYYYIPTSVSVSIVGQNNQPPPLPSTTSTSDTNIAQIKQTVEGQNNWLYTLTILAVIGLAIPIILQYTRRGSNVINKQVENVVQEPQKQLPKKESITNQFGKLKNKYD